MHNLKQNIELHPPLTEVSAMRKHYTLFTTTLFATLWAALVSLSAHAFIIEPFVGYEMGDYKTGSGKNDLAGMNFGARLGGTTLGFMYGVEFQAGTVSYENPGNADVDLDTTDIGAFVGYELPILLRAWATYYFSHKADVSTGGDRKGDGGMKIGVGFTGLPLVSINLELMNRKFDESSSGAIDHSTNAYMLSLSVPLP
jgi:hypothetical protein